MKHIIRTILALAAAVAMLAGCEDGFGKKLYGPDSTVAPEDAGDQTLVFLDMTGSEAGAPVSQMPVDVIFAADQPIGQTRDVTMSARMESGRSRLDCNFSVEIRDDEALLQAYAEANGYDVTPLPQESFLLLTDIISIEAGGQTAVSQSILRLVNSSSLVQDRDYLLILELMPEAGFIIEESNSLLYVHVKRRGGSGEPVGAADFRPMPGDNALDADGVDLGINRNNLYYELRDADNLENLDACTIEGLVYVDSFKDASERGDGTLAGISSVWGYEAGSDSDFLLRFGDASISPDRLQLCLGDEKYIIDYTFREKQWYHIALTFNGTELNFYVNGRSRFTMQHSGKLNLSTSGYFNLGQSFNQWRGFNGMMSEVRIWSVARTSRELRDNAVSLADLNSSRDLLLAYWRMNEAMAGSDGTKIEDVSGNGNDITVARQGASDGSIVPKVIINTDIDINLR